MGWLTAGARPPRSALAALLMAAGCLAAPSPSEDGDAAADGSDAGGASCETPIMEDSFGDEDTSNGLWKYWVPSAQATISVIEGGEGELRVTADPTDADSGYADVWSYQERSIAGTAVEFDLTATLTGDGEFTIGWAREPGIPIVKLKIWRSRIYAAWQDAGDVGVTGICDEGCIPFSSERWRMRLRETGGRVLFEVAEGEGEWQLLGDGPALDVIAIHLNVFAPSGAAHESHLFVDRIRWLECAE